MSRYGSPDAIFLMNSANQVKVYRGRRELGTA
jgi:hypothetical protein